MELTPYLFWNIFITLVLAPILYSIRQNASEAKRIDILLNKTREEMARQYVCLLYTSPSPRDYAASRMPSSA